MLPCDCTYRLPLKNWSVAKFFCEHNLKITKTRMLKSKRMSTKKFAKCLRHIVRLISCFLLEVRGAHLGVTWLWLEAGVSTSTSPSAGGDARAVASPALLNRLLVGISGTDTADPYCIRSCSLAVYKHTRLQVRTVEPRLHDTTGCQTNLTTGLTTGCIV